MRGAKHPPAWCMAAWPAANCNWSVRPSWSTPVTCSVCCICVYEKRMRQSSGPAGVSNVRATAAIARQGKAKNARFSHLSKNYLLSATEKVLSRYGGAAACPTFLYWKMRTGYKQAFFNVARARNALPQRVGLKIALRQQCAPPPMARTHWQVLRSSMAASY